MTTTTCFAPAAVNCLPAPSPAIPSSWPTCVSNDERLSKAPSPELTVMIVMPLA
jgi:hypothetical protein